MGTLKKGDHPLWTKTGRPATLKLMEQKDRQRYVWKADGEKIPERIRRAREALENVK